MNCEFHYMFMDICLISGACLYSASSTHTAVLLLLATVTKGLLHCVIQIEHGLSSTVDAARSSETAVHVFTSLNKFTNSNSSPFQGVQISYSAVLCTHNTKFSIA